MLVNYLKLFFVIYVDEAMELIVFQYILKVVRKGGTLIRKLFLKIKERLCLKSLKIGMKLLPKKERLLRKNWIN